MVHILFFVDFLSRQSIVRYREDSKDLVECFEQ